MREPFALTMYQFLMLTERERIGDVFERAKQVQLANMIAFAMNKPEGLKTFVTDVQRDIESMKPSRRKIITLSPDESRKAAIQNALAWQKLKEAGLTQKVT